MIKKDINEAKGKTHSDYSTYQAIDIGDLVFCLFDIEETPRTIGVSKYNGMITSAYTVMRLKQGYDSQYLYYLFQNIDDFKSLGSQYSGLRKTIRPLKFIKLNIAYPSLYEQTQIATFLNHETAKIDNLVAKQKALIEKLKEYRASVISQAVTGKIDIRELVA